MDTIMRKIKLTKIFMIFLAVVLMFWWPLSHWFYSEWYHSILGFTSWDESMVKMIGTCGILPVLILFNTGLDPVRRRGNVICIIVFMFLLGFTFIYLIQNGFFPKGEYFNVVMCFLSGFITIAIYPWRMIIE